MQYRPYRRQPTAPRPPGVARRWHNSAGLRRQLSWPDHNLAAAIHRASGPLCAESASAHKKARHGVFFRPRIMMQQFWICPFSTNAAGNLPLLVAWRCALLAAAVAFLAGNRCLGADASDSSAYREHARQQPGDAERGKAARRRRESHAVPALPPDRG